jgi:hypothetical protein
LERFTYRDIVYAESARPVFYYIYDVHSEVTLFGAFVFGVISWSESKITGMFEMQETSIA